MVARVSITMLAAVALIALALSAAAAAKGPQVRVTGACTKSSHSKLKLSQDNSRIDVEFEVDQNVNGVRWNVTLSRAGTVLFNGTRTTRGPSGSFELRRFVSDMAGADRITAKATRAGETCRATATI